MKTLGLILGMLLSGLVVKAQDTKGVDVTIIIENVLSNEGKIIGALHTQDTFMKGPGIKNTIIDAITGEASLTFSDVAPGTFALLIMHDTNGNNRMDFDTNGMPQESYATSGEVSFGPPNFEDSKFEVANKDLAIRIRF
ncbi:DUF2141 domain-containing protein [Maribacter sp. CXY002]|uniref:DUF2141 domain-containing protein n=1 Tax=Maribacter luteocoastalis TaxID=3407671 RepID=UPI003B677476